MDARLKVAKRMAPAVRLLLQDASDEDVVVILDKNDEITPQLVPEDILAQFADVVIPQDALPVVACKVPRGRLLQPLDDTARNVLQSAFNQAMANNDRLVLVVAYGGLTATAPFE
jgi:hypothetical protein